MRATTRALHVDLTARTVTSEAIPEPWRRRFVGGKGLGARILFEELDAGTDALGPGNIICFALGPVSGLLPGETRYAAVTKSPLTGAFLDSYAGGAFPEALTGALNDHLILIVRGAADEPVRLVIEDGDVDIKPATTWGQDAAKTCRAHEGAVACIGPAGERGVAYATIASGPEATHHAGRGGAGAVMGAKQLKAVVARGDPPERLADLRAEYEQRYTEGPTGRWLAASETLETVDFAAEAGVLSSRGWSDRGFEGVADVGIEAAREAAHGREHEGESVPGGFRVRTAVGETVPRGATSMTLGAGLGIDDFDAVAELGEVCNRLGMDLISAGNAVAWAARASEEGVLDNEYAFGDPEGARALLGAIAARKGELGDALANGVAEAAARLGGKGLVPTVKGMELPAYDPRGAASMALAYATSDRGGCHRRARPVEREPFEGPFSPEAAAAAVIDEQDTRAVRWSLVADDFTGETLESDGEEWLEAVSAPTEGLADAGERIWNLVRLFNVREGFDRADDRLPSPLAPADLATDFEALLDAYYQQRGWNAEGAPTQETLARLDIDHLRW